MSVDSTTCTISGHFTRPHDTCLLAALLYGIIFCLLRHKDFNCVLLSICLTISQTLVTMKSLVFSTFAVQALGHAIWQDLWVNGVDKASTCVRLPGTSYVSNSPVTSVSSNDIRCNAGGSKGVAGKCAVAAGDTVTVEMHQQNGDRGCKNEAIGGAHYGPVMVYMSKVDDSSKANGSSGWFKVYENGWAAANKGAADNDNWGVKDLNACCGKVDVKIPTALAAGDYLLRAEVIALHTAGSSGGAQFYMSCYQLTVSGTGTLSPQTVKFPGAYKASDAGIMINIHSSVSKYVIPGPAVIAEGQTVVPGAPVCPKAKMIRGFNNLLG
ncbi:hypothetical protein HBH53_093160 [Parastagonospora nodorum]|nr:hypothetical protein HBH53_093160 [Parastagonospora nodorum]KAH4124219.1 hypothetical protein HBH47_069580 [Parastagonospora nodorum]KAH4822812.1 hypothetical protein HBH61_003680 [Parastagonospora nodorum]KAH4951915.1 hypothetical protein HBH74_010880 [Parastagonospora nodorum]KAH4996942.1 hypothetical protein HBH73_002680 [Parastagonospora nodorum]